MRWGVTGHYGPRGTERLAWWMTWWGRYHWDFRGTLTGEQWGADSHPGKGASGAWNLDD